MISNLTFEEIEFLLQYKYDHPEAASELKQKYPELFDATFLVEFLKNYFQKYESKIYEEFEIKSNTLNH